ncbi:MAG: hypothetical protein JWP15_2640 [Alphaproteobacteria bacterium]|nr:hypothetical protein [Alphaproteobacteria bacterium]
MFKFEDIKHSAFAALAAIVLSATMIAAAVGPVRVADHAASAAQA